MKLLDLAAYDQFIGLFLGRSGSGKSVAEASFAEFGPLEIIDLDRRARGILGATKFLASELLDRITVSQYTVKDGWKELNNKFELWDVYVRTNKLPFKTICIESVTTLQKWLIIDSMKLRGVDVGKLRGGLQFATPDDYNYASIAFMKLIYEVLMPLKCNVILSGWLVNEYGKPPGDSNQYAPNIVIGQKVLGTQKMAEEIPGYFDEVYVFEKEEITGTSNPVKFTVTFEGGLAKTSRTELKGKQKVDLTNRSFYQTYQQLTQKGK